ncbi:MAG: aspartate kinase, partial [Candidatus Moranbacteria bacterium]|nr:aspartate kinase [Candidatus Moranbacteria bacterium]
MRVFKFGGASVKDAASVKNVANIIRQYGNGPLVVVVSAMGKTTNALERLTSYFMNQE